MSTFNYFPGSVWFLLILSVSLLCSWFIISWTFWHSIGAYPVSADRPSSKRPSAHKSYQTSSRLQDSFQYSYPSQQCCGLDGLNSFSDFQFLQLSFQTLGTGPSVPIVPGMTVSLMFFSFLSFIFSILTALGTGPSVPIVPGMTVRPHVL